MQCRLVLCCSLLQQLSSTTDSLGMQMNLSNFRPHLHRIIYSSDIFSFVIHNGFHNSCDSSCVYMHQISAVTCW